jgi:hypothetical protein
MKNKFLIKIAAAVVGLVAAGMVPAYATLSLTITSGSSTEGPLLDSGNGYVLVTSTSVGNWSGLSFIAAEGPPINGTGSQPILSITPGNAVDTTSGSPNLVETLAYTDGSSSLAAGSITLNLQDGNANSSQNTLAAYINGNLIGSTSAPGIVSFNTGPYAAGYTLTEVLTLTANPSANGGIDTANGYVTYGAPVPEPTTIVAGALLLLPFGASTLRILRKRQVA